MIDCFIRCMRLSRECGYRVTAHAAILAGERIFDERTQEERDFRHRRSQVMFARIILPAAMKGPEAAWARNRSRLWNAAEQHRTTPEVSLAYEWFTYVPIELEASCREDLLLRFANELAEHYHAAVDLTLHWPNAADPGLGCIARFLMSARQVTPEGFGPRTELDQLCLPGILHPRGWPARMVRPMCERWRGLLNHSLITAGLEPTGSLV